MPSTVRLVQQLREAFGKKKGVKKGVFQSWSFAAGAAEGFYEDVEELTDKIRGEMPDTVPPELASEIKAFKMALQRLESAAFEVEEEAKDLERAIQAAQESD